MQIQDVDFSSLSTAERLQLAQSLLDSVLEAEAAPFTDEQLAELDRRVAYMDAGKATFESWDRVLKRLINQ